MTPKELLTQLKHDYPHSWERKYRMIFSEPEIIELHGSIDNYLDLISEISGNRQLKKKAKEHIKYVAEQKAILTKRSVGRPPKPKNEKLSEYICLKLKPDQYDYLKRKSCEFGIKPQQFIREFVFPHELK